MRDAPKDRRDDDAPVLAVDLGGTNTRVATVTPDGTVVRREVIPTEHDDSHPSALIELIATVAEGSGAGSAVVGVPGRIDHVEGRLEFAPNLPAHWARHLTRERLSDATGLDVELANDADLAAVGEHRYGTGVGVADMVYLTMSTGVGCGVIAGGQLMHGRRSLAEAGHTIVDVHAEAGRRTLEQTASGTALGRIAAGAGVPARGPDLLEHVLAGDEAATDVWREMIVAAAAGIANLAHLYSPQLIVIGGGLGLAGEPLYEPLRQALAVDGPKDLPEAIRIEGAALGDDAGLIGATGWAAATRWGVAGSRPERHGDHEGGARGPSAAVAP